MPVDETKYFFSYARDDSDFVLKLAKELRAAGANLWLDQLDIVGGQRWDRAVEEALATCQSMIVVLSPESVASNNVMDEVSYALEENKLVIPVLRKDCSIPFRLRRVQRIDFTADYDTGFADLLRALRIVATKPPEPEKQIAQRVKEPSATTSTVTARKPPEKQAPQHLSKQSAPTSRKSAYDPSNRARKILTWGLLGFFAGAMAGLIAYSDSSWGDLLGASIGVGYLGALGGLFINVFIIALLERFRKRQ